MPKLEQNKVSKKIFLANEVIFIQLFEEKQVS